jgi:hypothetical protein
MADLRGCTEAILHGPADFRGRCPWCGVKYDAARPAPSFYGYTWASDLDRAYRRMYDPNWGTGLTDFDI